MEGYVYEEREIAAAIEEAKRQLGFKLRPKQYETVLNLVRC